MKYTVVIEKAKKNYSAYVPDLPGCVAVGDTLEEVKQMIREAIEFHLEGMLLDGEPVPEATTQSCQVTVNPAKIAASIQKGKTNR
jgi:predicted RNase H-like HicB family nuclease